MKVLHCIWSGEVGGAERALYQLVKAQKRDGDLDVAVLFGRAKGHYSELLRSAGCPVIDAGLRHGGDILGLPRLIRVMRAFDVHHFHSVEPLMLGASVVCSHAARVYTRRAGAVDMKVSVRRRVRYGVGNFLLRHKFHGYSANSKHSARIGARQLGVPEESFSVVYNGIDFELLQPAAKNPSLRHDLGIPPGARIVGTTAVFKSWKRVDRLLSAASQVPECWVLLVGDGPDRHHLERTVAGLGLLDRTRFCGRQENVADYVGIMDVFVLPSGPEESFGNALVEAMALGIPGVVFADSPGPCEHVADGRTGFVVRDVSHLAQTLERLLANPDLRARVGKMGADAVREKYSVAAATRSYKTLYARSVALA